MTDATENTSTAANSMADEPVLLGTPDNPVPDRHMAGYLAAHDGKKLRYAIFKSEASVARGTIVLLQGRNEFIEKYFETIRHFTERGFWVATFDWRGQGGSERLLKPKHDLRGHVRRFSDLELDLNRFLEEIVLPETRLPFLLLAHSMGGLVALKAAPQLTNRIDRMALCAPFVDLSNERAGIQFIQLFCRLLSLIGLGWITFDKDNFPRPFENNVLTSDKARFERNQNVYRAFPRLRLGPPTASWVAAMLGAMRKVRKLAHLDSIKVPTLIIAAGSDTIVDHKSIETVANRFRAGHLITIDNARHELLQEADRYRLSALAAIDTFLTPADDTDPVALTARITGEERKAEAASAESETSSEIAGSVMNS